MTPANRIQQRIQRLFLSITIYVLTFQTKPQTAYRGSRNMFRYNQNHQQRQQQYRRQPTMTSQMFIIFMVTTCLFGQHTAHASSSQSHHEIEITLNGSQYIEKSLLVDATHQKKNELQIIFKTAISSGLLFYASGTNGDYIVLELIHGKLRYDFVFCFFFVHIVDSSFSLFFNHVSHMVI